MAPNKDEMTYLHLAYLQQVSELLADKHKPLSAKYGYIAKKISQKHVVHVNGADSPKLFGCKACQAPIGQQDIITKNKKLVVKCPLCQFQRCYSISRHNLKKMQRRDELSNELPKVDSDILMEDE